MTANNRKLISFDWTVKKITPLLAFLIALGVNAANAEDVNAKLQKLQQALAANPDNAILLNETGFALYESGRYSEVEQLYLRSLAIFEKTLGKNHTNVATVLNNLALLYEDQSKYKQAELLYQRSLEIRKKKLGKNHPDVAQSLNNLAAVYERQGKYSDAALLYQKSLAIREKTLGKDHADIAESLNNLAGLYRLQGLYEKSEPLYLRSLENFEKNLGKNHASVAISLNNLALLYKTQGKYKQAESLYQRSLAIDEKNFGENSSTYAMDLNNLASLYRVQAHYEKAEPIYKKALAIDEKVLGENHIDVAIISNGLGELYRIQSRYLEAESLYQKSLTIRKILLGERSHPSIARILNNLGLLYYAQGEYEKAEPLFQQSLDIWGKSLGENHPDIALSLTNLATLYNSQGNYQKAKPYLQKSLRIMNQSLNNWLWGAGDKTRQSYLQQETSKHNIYLTFYSLANTPEEALYFSLSRKSLLLRVSSELSVLTKQISDFTIQKQVQEFTALRSQLANLVFSNKADKVQIQELEEKSNTLEMQISQQVSGFKRNKAEVTPDQVLEKLSPEQVVIDFLVFTEKDFKTTKDKTEQIIALVADKQNGIKLIKLGEFTPIAAAIKTYQTAIVPTKENANSREKTIAQTAQTLYEKLWQPLTPYLQNKKTVYLIPDGDLHLLTFKALQDPDGKYLAEKWQLITLSSARDIVLPPLEGKASAAAIFAAPDYGDDTAIIKAGNTTGATELKNIHFDPLPNALNEGQQIDKLFIKKQPEPAAKLFLKAQATEQAINTLTAPKILHLSTHGFFLEDNKPDEKILEHGRGLMRGLDEAVPVGKIENPLTRSGLAFANANFGVKGIKQKDGTDGILTALEVLNLDLAGTDLVILSACDTGKGDVKIGEGVYSLNRAFQEAGAKAVLSTLWAMDDKPTSLFMQRFYELFLSGKPAQQAIQETQNEFMHDEKYKQYSNPYYWAGFVMIGKE